MEIQVGQKKRLKLDSHDYTGKYAGTMVTITEVDNEFFCTVAGFDGRNFSCPISYFEDDNSFWFPGTRGDNKCTCGAVVAYGDDCLPYYHYDYCPLYKPKD